MPDCDYCGDRFDDEDAYLDHLAAEHDGELTSIDRRRVDDRGDDGDGIPTATILGVVGVVAVAAVGGWLLFGGGGGSGPTGNQTTGGQITAEGNTIVSFNGSAPDGLETEPLPNSGRDDVISVVSEEPFTGQASHVSPGSLNYDPNNPPTAGPHTNGALPAGFYEEQATFGDIVHSLEHGAVVIYYDPEQITPEARQSLRAFAQQHTGTWQSVVVLPHPGDSPPAYELTAWERRLKMQEYDARAVRAFVAEYIGRGPENPVRPPL